MASDFKHNLWEVLAAIAPITGVVVLLQVSFIHMPMVTFARFLMGGVLVMIGLFLFLQGVRIGLLPMGEMIGNELPKRAGLPLILLTAFLLGFVVTVAEPDVRVLAHQVDVVSEGQIGKTHLILTVAFGIGLFVALGMARILHGIPVHYFIIPGYLTAIIMLRFTDSTFISIAFDAGGVATGPMTVTFVMAMAVGIATVMEHRSPILDGFGLIALVALAPILSVMGFGLFYSSRKGK